METLSKKLEQTKTTVTPIFPQRDPKVATVVMLYRDELRRREEERQENSSVFNEHRHEIIQRAINTNPVIQRRTQLAARGPHRDFTSAPALGIPIQRQPALAATISGYKSYLQRKNKDKESTQEYPAIQTKLQISQPHDPAEIEADNVSEQIMRMPDTSVYGNKARNLVRRHSSKVSAKQSIDILQRSKRSAGASTPAVNNNLASQIQGLNGKGQPLPEKIRTEFEGKFGHSFENVRVHAGSESSSMAQSINAKAFTTGNNIVFGEGQYNTESNEGKKLLAHELTHTIQQEDLVSRKADRKESSSEKTSILRERINKFAMNLPGYSLLITVLGRNPITNQIVSKSGKSYIQAFLGLVPGGELIFQNLAKTGAIELALNWFTSEVKSMNLSWSALQAQLEKVWDSIQLWKVLKWDDYISSFINILKIPAEKLVQFGGKLKTKAKELMLRSALNMAGPFGREIFKILNRGNNTLAVIVNHPTLFIGNFFAAVKNSFLTFKQNFASFFRTSIFEWMFGVLQGADITIPDKLNLAGIFSVTAQVLGLTYQAIRLRAVKGLGKVVGEEKAEKAVSLAEKSVSFVLTLAKQGPFGLWEEIKDKLSNIKDLVMGPVLNWIRNTIIFRAIEKLITMLIPGAGLVAAIMSLYRVVRFFMENIGRIKTMVLGIFSSISSVAAGNISGASKLIVGVMAKGMTFLVRFLANFLRLGGIGKAIQKAITKIRQPIDKALDFVISKIINISKRFLSKVKAGGQATVERIIEWWKIRRKFKTISGEEHTLFFKGKMKTAKLMIASDPIELESFLKFNKVQLIDINEKQFEEAVKQLKKIRSLSIIAGGKAETSSEQKKIRSVSREMASKINELSSTLASLLGENKMAEPPKPEWKPKDGEGKQYPEIASVEWLTKERTKVGTTRGTAKPGGWELLISNKKYKKELVDSKQWVRIHLISEKLGGKAVEGNLIPGPKTVNSQILHYAENPLKYTLDTFGNDKKEKLPRGYKPLPVKHDPVMWIKSRVKYHGETTIEGNTIYHWASQVQINAGFHYYDGIKQQWLTDVKPLFNLNFPVPLPRFEQKPLNINTATRNELLELDFKKTDIERAEFKPRLGKFFDTLVLERRKNKFTDFANFKNRMRVKAIRKSGLGKFIKSIEDLSDMGLIVWKKD